MSNKSLRKIEKSRRSRTAKLTSQNLHLVKGEHSVTNSHSPISADELHKLTELNPAYADRLIGIMESSIAIEQQERELFYNAIDKEQENDKLAIESETNLKEKSLYFTIIIIGAFLISSLIFAYSGHEVIAGTIITVGLVGVIKAMFSKNKK